MVWGVYLGLEKRLQENLGDPQNRTILKRVLEWQSKGGAQEVERRLLEMIENIISPGDKDE